MCKIWRARKERIGRKCLQIKKFTLYHSIPKRLILVIDGKGSEKYKYINKFEILCSVISLIPYYSRRCLRI